MQPLSMKRFSENSTKPALHVATFVVRYESVVSKITGTEYPAHNLIDVNDSGKFSILGANPIAEVRSALQPFEARFESGGSRRWTSPVPVQLAARSHSDQEFISPRQ